MDEQEFENKIKNALYINTTPKRESFKHVLLSLKDTDVTKNKTMRYNTQTATSNIINNKITHIIGIWMSKRIILVPSFIVLILIGAFSLSKHSQNSNSEILKIAEQNETIEEPGIDDDDEDQIILTNFDMSDVDDIGIVTNEIKS